MSGTQLELWEVNHVLNVSPRIRPWLGCWDTSGPDPSLALAKWGWGEMGWASVIPHGSNELQQVMRSSHCDLKISCTIKFYAPMNNRSVFHFKWSIKGAAGLSLLCALFVHISNCDLNCLVGISLILGCSMTSLWWLWPVICFIIMHNFHNLFR